MITKTFEGFNKIVILSATVVLCILLLTISITLTNAYNNIEFPPISNLCPEYWDISYSSTGSVICNNVNNINASDNTHPDCKSPFIPENHDKDDWIKKCKVEWDAHSG